MTRKMSCLFVLGALSSVAISTLAQAQTAEQSEDIINLRTVTCRDLLQTDGDDRSNTIVFMHGYFNGRASDSKINGLELAEKTDQIIDACVAAPDRNLLTVFEGTRSSPSSQPASEAPPAPQAIPQSPTPVPEPAAVPAVPGLW